MTKQQYRAANFVAPYPRDRSPVPEVEQPIPTRGELLPPAPQTVLLPKANYVDRAVGFTVATMPLAAIAGLVTMLIGIAAFGVPALSVAALLLALAGFAAVWLAAYIAHVLISPDGALFAHTVMMWSYLRREQRERFRRYRSLYENRRGGE